MRFTAALVLASLSSPGPGVDPAPLTTGSRGAPAASPAERAPVLIAQSVCGPVELVVPGSWRNRGSDLQDVGYHVSVRARTSPLPCWHPDRWPNDDEYGELKGKVKGSAPFLPTGYDGRHFPQSTLPEERPWGVKACTDLPGGNALYVTYESDDRKKKDAALAKEARTILAQVRQAAETAFAGLLLTPPDCGLTSKVALDAKGWKVEIPGRWEASQKPGVIDRLGLVTRTRILVEPRPLGCNDYVAGLGREASDRGQAVPFSLPLEGFTTAASKTEKGTRYVACSPSGTTLVSVEYGGEAAGAEASYLGGVVKAMVGAH